jgi:hypothetical protein
VHVQPPPSRREAVADSGRRTAGVVRGREQRPGHGGGVEGVEVVEKVCSRPDSSGSVTNQGRLLVREAVGVSAAIRRNLPRAPCTAGNSNEVTQLGPEFVPSPKDEACLFSLGLSIAV